MDSKLIYHYTTIETLVLILRNHTIRFSRLDKVDDIEESEFSSGPANVRLGNYVFASCWTRCEEESVAPRTSVVQEAIVKALLNQYVPKAVLRHSELKLRK